MLVHVQGTGIRLTYVVAHANVPRRQLAMMAREVTGVSPGRPLNIFIANHSKAPIAIPKEKIFAQSAGVPRQLADDDVEVQIDTPIVNLVHNKPSVTLNVQMGTERTVGQDDAEKKKVDWRNSIELLEESGSSVHLCPRCNQNSPQCGMATLHAHMRQSTTLI